MRIETVKISKLIKNPDNPRTIKDKKFELLKQSIVDFPEMLELREIVVDENYMILGGNMRYEAQKALGYTDVTIKIADGLTNEQKKQFIIKDNANFGDWDFDELANSWEITELTDWGVDLPNWDLNTENEVQPDEKYSRKIADPIYEMTKEKKPEIVELYNSDKYKQLIIEIENSNLSNGEKDFLKVAASRHIVFNYSNIAEFYAHSNKETQNLMENNGLVIIDFDKAIENGFAKLTNEIAELSGIDNDEA